MAQLPVIDLTQSYTADEFEQLPESVGRYELRDGGLVEKPMPGYEHSWIALLLIKLYLEFDPKMKLGTMLQEASTKLGPKNVPQPDLSFWRANNRPSPHTKGAGPRPDLAIEIWSPSDLESAPALQEVRNKVRRYLAAGVPLVWAISPANQVVEVYHIGQLEPILFGITETLEGENIIPGFSFSVKNLFMEESDLEEIN
ncbi:MAG: Uma2 family endonuclease [Chloroflexi bacterium]|nr:Uma2 family endonuclease [Chloroflexota bacterium]